MKFMGVFLVTMFCFVSVASGQDASKCVLIENDLDRLSCYDRILGRDPAVAEGKSSGEWNARTEVSDFNDTTSVYLAVDSLQSVACGFAGAKKITLMARCVENTTSLIIGTHCHVASGFQNYGEVEVRLDQDKTRTLQFSASTNNRALGLWSGRKAIPLIQSMFGAEEMLVRFTPFNENPVTARFPISGLEEAVKPLRENCNW